jgi:hypothetical protein
MIHPGTIFKFQCNIIEFKLFGEQNIGFPVFDNKLKEIEGVINLTKNKNQFLQPNIISLKSHPVLKCLNNNIMFNKIHSKDKLIRQSRFEFMINKPKWV